MKNKLICILILGILLFSITATASMLIPSSDRAKERSKAPDKSPVITETESGEWELDRIDFIHYARPDKPGKPPKGPKTESCYKLMGVKWKSLPVDYVINPLNPDNLSEDFVLNTISSSAEVWDDATSSELFNNVYTIDYTAAYGVQNYENAIVFGDHPDSNVIGVTSIWFTRKGKKIVEFDMLFNTDFEWGDAEIDPLVMDLKNIAIHELGHSVGLDDIYSTTCDHVTMYGYSDYGEISKRSLEQPDITGLQAMYG